MTKKELIEDGFSEEAIDAYIELIDDDLEDFEEAYQGDWKSDEDFVEDLLSDIGVLPNLPSYIHIDWERTANDVMMDYSEENGYYFRNL